MAPAPARRDRTLFLWKAGLLLATTLALIPILAWKHELAATTYVAFLVTVHVAGLGIFLYGVRRRTLAPNTRGFLVRIAGLIALFSLAGLASQGLHAGLHSTIFWASLTAIWALHTAGAALLHLRPQSARANGHADAGSLCPFL